MPNVESSASQRYKIGIIAGELSGDELGAALINELKKKLPHATFFGIAGPAMQQAGAISRYPMERLSVMGLIEPLKHIPSLLKMRRALYHEFVSEQIDIFIGIDSPDFNLGLEIALRQAGIKVIHYVSPSVWAWRQWRWRKIARAVDRILTLFPFEAAFFQQHHIPVSYVGHPLADRIPMQSDKQVARSQLNITTDIPVMALLPGSRMGELKYLAALFIETARACQQQLPRLQFVAAMANQRCRDYFTALLAQHAPELPVTLIDGQAQLAMSAADVVLLASGTATLECMLIKRPMVVSYRVSAFTAWLARRLLKIKYVSLPNLLLDQAVVPELLQEHGTVENLTNALLNILRDKKLYADLLAQFTQLHQQLRCHAAEKAATAVIEVLKNV